ncbi:U37 [Human betaherpesvirus 6A]|uniref:Nuclear egress protein 1 n=1 Tax=Human herpesvirus 6A (strain Uganda-1102) TaxID=10370 RepID=NEC1_HHV6U|nr:U37 [Human betaherpesvirus 6A]P28865.2 RecName: Full=Nuclear egress protein 1 [Human herpesvirus 6 (strain Uganda-1102)]CAA58417.1 U37 [Human betaherpesvirus 6A]
MTVHKSRIRRSRSLSVTHRIQKRPDHREKTKLYLQLKLHDLHTVFNLFPEYEQKFLAIIKLPITGKEPIDVPFSLSNHHQHTCLEFSPYANEQISKSACLHCESVSVPTSSDAMVAHLNQVNNVMQNRLYFYGFRKDMELIRMSAKQPTIFQIFYIVHNTINNIFPIMFERKQKLGMHIVFQSRTLHIPCECIKQIVAVSSGYNVYLDILQESVILTVLCETLDTNTNIHIDIGMLQKKLEEMDIPNEISDRLEKYKGHLIGFH